MEKSPSRFMGIKEDVKNSIPLHKAPNNLLITRKKKVQSTKRNPSMNKNKPAMNKRVKSNPRDERDRGKKEEKEV